MTHSVCVIAGLIMINVQSIVLAMKNVLRVAQYLKRVTRVTPGSVKDMSKPARHQMTLAEIHVHMQMKVLVEQLVAVGFPILGATTNILLGVIIRKNI